jgi:hypothetical protein
MTRKQVHLAYVFAFIASASITTQMLSSVPGSELLGTLLPGVKVMDRAQSIELDRQRKAVMEHCQKLTALDPSARCPDINEEWKFDQFLRQMPSLHGAAPSAGALDPSRLSEADRAVLDRAVNNDRCPLTLRRILPGFYELCVSLTIQEHGQNLPAAPLTMEERAAARREKRMRGR